MEETLVSHHEVEKVEGGNIYFFYRTGGNGSRHSGKDLKQQFYLILKPQTREKFRVLMLTRKAQGVEPDPRQPIWGTVECIEYLQRKIDNPWQQALLFPEDEQPLSLPEALPVARGRYDIVRHKEIHHLVYAVDNENQALSFTERFCFSLKGCYAIQIKNPDTKLTVALHGDNHRRVRYPEHLQQRFKQRPFISKEAHEYLDYTGAEFLMIATHQKFKHEVVDHKHASTAPWRHLKFPELPFRRLPQNPVTI